VPAIQALEAGPISPLEVFQAIAPEREGPAILFDNHAELAAEGVVPAATR